PPGPHPPPAPPPGGNGRASADPMADLTGAGGEFGPVGGGIGSDEEWTSVVGLTDYAAIMRHFLGEVR
ncbi:MAG: hypothetical protein ACK48C_03175, partial [Roseiflexaceae bacterium]